MVDVRRLPWAPRHSQDGLRETRHPWGPTCLSPRHIAQSSGGLRASSAAGPSHRRRPPPLYSGGPRRPGSGDVLPHVHVLSFLCDEADRPTGHGRPAAGERGCGGCRGRVASPSGRFQAGQPTASRCDPLTPGQLQPVLSSGRGTALPGLTAPGPAWLGWSARWGGQSSGASGHPDCRSEPRGQQQVPPNQR